MRFFVLIFLFVFAYSKPFDFNRSDFNSTFTSIQIDFNVVDERGYLDRFYKLIYLENLYLHLPEINKALHKKISTLSLDYSKFKSQIEFYRQKLLSNQKMYLYLNRYLPLFEKEAFRALREVYFDTLKAKERIKEYVKLLESKKSKLEDLDISLQKNLVDINKVMIIKKEIEKINNSILDIKKKLIKEYLVLWLDALKRGDKKAFEISDEIFLLADGFDFYEGLKRVIINLEKLSFGEEIIIYNAKSAAIWVKIKDILSYPLFKIGEMVITPLNFGIMIFILIAGLFVGRYYKKTIFSIRKRYNLSHSTATLLGNLGYYLIFVVAFLLALKAVGLNLSSLTIIAGALSVGIGFGLQNIVSNFVSGIILMFENSIKVGDYIQIDEDTKGEVIDISMRSTIIRTNDNIDLIIPNQTFIQNNVINWTLNDEVVRFKIPFGVAYGSDLKKVKRVVLEALKKSKLPYVKEHKKLDVTPRVIFKSMGSSSLDFELVVWIRGEYARWPSYAVSDFMFLIYESLVENGIRIPFNQHDLHIRDSIPFEITIKKEKDDNKKAL